MLRLSLAVLVVTVACQRRHRVAPERATAPAVRAVPRDAAVDAPRDATARTPVDAPRDAPPPDAPSGNVLHGAPMHGPTPTLHASCMTAAPCGGAKEKGMADFADPPKSPDCSQLDSDPNSTKPETLDGGPVRVGSVQCAIPPELKMHWTGQSYHLFAHRADGWWRSDELYSTFTNNKYDSEDLSASWDRQGTRYLLRLRREVGTVACSKQTGVTMVAEALYIIDLAGAVPEVYGPIVVGGGRTVELWGEFPPDDEADDDDCKPTRTAARLHVRWIDASTLELSGRANQKLGLAAPGRYQLVP